MAVKNPVNALSTEGSFRRAIADTSPWKGRAVRRRSFPPESESLHDTPCLAVAHARRQLSRPSEATAFYNSITA